MIDQARARKLADRIREVAADTLERQVKDPRLGFVTVTAARVTPDLRDATVFYTVYGDESERVASAQALESAKGVVRAEVGRQTRVRFTPSVTFVADIVPDTAQHIEDLLARARAADEQVQRAAEGAQPAGDPDPYRVPRAGDDAADPDADLHADEDLHADADLHADPDLGPDKGPARGGMPDAADREAAG